MANDEFRPDVEGLARILGSLPHHVVVMDREGRIVYLNHTGEEYSPEDFVGRLVSELVPPDSQEVADRAFQRLEETGEAQEYEVLASLPDGFEAWYRTRLSWLGDSAEGGLALLVSQDVTAEKKAEAETARLKQLLPMCAWCNRIQDEQGNWSPIETYLARRGDTAVSHGICPRCEEEHMGEGHEGEANGSAA